MDDQKFIIYELVWRVFKNTLIHENIFRFETDKLLTWGKRGIQLDFFTGESVFIEPIRWRKQDDFGLGFSDGHSTYYWERNDYFLRNGFPSPEQGGLPVPCGAVSIVRIFMDDLFLCPDCGGFDSPMRRRWPEIKWWDSRREDLDAPAMLDAAAERRNAKEFSIRKHKDPRLCPDTIHKEQRRRDREAEQERARQAAFAIHEEELRKRAEEQRRQASERVEAVKPDRCVYLVGTPVQSGLVKIGIATDVRRRMKNLQTNCPFPLKLLKNWKCNDPLTFERKLHSKYARHRRIGEWFCLPDHLFAALVSVEDLESFLKRKPSRGTPPVTTP